MITIEEIKQFIAEYGLAMPEFLLSILLDKANSIDASMVDAGYSDSDKKLIKLYSVALMAIAQGARQISSQSGPSGAGRSFRYESLADVKASLTAALSNIDTANCAGTLAPTEVGGGFMLVAGG